MILWNPTYPKINDYWYTLYRRSFSSELLPLEFELVRDALRLHVLKEPPGFFGVYRHHDVAGYPWHVDGDGISPNFTSCSLALQWYIDTQSKEKK